MLLDSIDAQRVEQLSSGLSIKPQGRDSDVNTDGIKAADWFALPTFTNPTFDGKAIILFLPVVLVLIAENVGHVKAVASMTGKDLDDQMS